MKLAAVRKYAMSLPEAAESPHFEYSSFRVRGKIFVTVPPGEEFVHVFAPEEPREVAVAMYPQFIEKLTWGSKVVGVRVAFSEAPPEVVKKLVLAAWKHKAPKSIQAKGE